MLLNEFDRVFAPLASLQQGAPIEFMVKGADQLYLDLNESLLLVRVMITKADNSDIGADTAGPVNLTLHSLFNKMSVEFNGKPVTEPNHLYPYRAYLETLIKYSEETKTTRLLCEGWTKDSRTHKGHRRHRSERRSLHSRRAVSEEQRCGLDWATPFRRVSTR